MATDSLMSEIQIFAFGFAPKNWLQCNGQLLAIAQNQALFSLLGTTYGGNGTTNFALPDLRSRTPNSAGKAPSGNIYNLGQPGGEEMHTLSQGEIPPHNHLMQASKTPADQPNADGNLLAAGPTGALYSNSANGATMAGNDIALGGGGQGHENRQPYLTLNYCICQFGIFPSRN
jgi:microcystin-dependent protein